MAKSQACLFCKIINHQENAAIVFEDDETVAFLDHRPLFHGHCLLVPKPHFETLTDLPERLLQPLFRNAQRLEKAVEAAMAAEGSFVAINNRVSQSVPHLHVHVVPRRRKDGLKGFFWPRHAYADSAEMASVQERILAALKSID